MLKTMTMTMQLVVQLVEADVLLVCLVEDGRISNLARSNNHRKWLRHACRGIPIWIIDKFLYPLKWVQDLDYNSELGSCLGSLNGRSRRSTTSISIREPPGWDWRGSKMAVLKYLICGISKIKSPPSIGYDPKVQRSKLSMMKHKNGYLRNLSSKPWWPLRSAIAWLFGSLT